MSNPRKRITIPTVLSEIAKPLVSKEKPGESSRDDSFSGKNEVEKEATKSRSETKEASVCDESGSTFEFKHITGVEHNEHFVKNIWDSKLPEVLPCKFIAFDGPSDRVELEICFLADDESVFKLETSVSRSIFIFNGEEEYSLPEKANMLLFENEKAVGSEEFANTNSYYKNTAFCLTRETILQEFGEEAADAYTREYELHVTQCYNKMQMQNEDNLYFVEQLIHFGHNDAFCNAFRCNVAENATLLKGKLCFNQLYLQADFNFVKPLIGEIQQVIECYIKQKPFVHIIDAVVAEIREQLEALMELREEFTESDPLNIISGLEYRSESIERKGKVQEQLVYLLESAQTFNSVLFESHYDSILKLSTIVQDREKAWETFITMLWNTIIPFLFFTAAGVLHYRILSGEIDTILRALAASEPLILDSTVFAVDEIYLLFLRSFESKAISILEDFQVGIESNILHVEDLDSEGRFIEASSSALYEQLQHINFNTDAGNYEKSPFKQFTTIQYAISTTCQPLENPSIESLQRYLYTKISKIYSLFFTLPIVTSQDFSYISQEYRQSGYLKLTDFYTVKQQEKSDILAQFTFEEREAGFSAYELLLVTYGQESTAGDDKAQFPAIAVEASNSTTLELFDEKLEEISSVLSFAFNCLSEFCIESFFIDPREQFAQLPQTEKICEAIAATAQTFGSIDFNLFLHWEQLERIITQFSALKSQVVEMPDFAYQFLVRLDFSIFKQQAVNLIDQYIFEYREAAAHMYEQIDRFLINNIKQLDNELERKITPDLLLQTQQLICELDELDVKYWYEMLYRVQFEVPAEFIEMFCDNVVLKDSGILFAFVRLIRGKKDVSDKLKEHQALFKFLIQFVIQWQGKMARNAIEYFHELSRIEPDDIVDAKQYPEKFRQNFKLISQNFNLLAMDHMQDNSDATQMALLEQNRQLEKEFYESFATGLRLPIYTKRYSAELLQTEQRGTDEHTHIPLLELYVRPANNSNEHFETWKFFNELQFIALELQKIQATVNEWNLSLGLQEISFQTELAAFELLQSLYEVFVYSNAVNSIFSGTEIALNRINGEELVRIARLCVSNVLSIKLISEEQIRFFEYEVSLKDLMPCVLIIEQTLQQQISYLYLLMLCQNKGITKQHASCIKDIYGIDILNTEITQNDIFACYNENQSLLDYLQHLSQSLEVDFACKAAIDRITADLVTHRFVGFFEIDEIIFLQFDDQFEKCSLNNFLREVQYYLLNQDFIQWGRRQSRVPPYLLRYQALVEQHCHSAEIERELRDLELLLELMLHFLVYSLHIPFILRELSFFSKYGNQIEYTHENYNMKINMLSPEDLSVFNSVKKYWGEAVKQFTPNQHVMTLCNKLSFIKELETLFTQLKPIYSRMMACGEEYYFKLLGYPNTELSYTTIIGKPSTAYYYIIPSINEQLYPASLILPKHPQIYMNVFPRHAYFYKFIFGTAHLIAPSVSDIIVSHSEIRHRVIIGLKSEQEDLIFKDSLIAPELNYQLPDTISKGMMTTIKAILHDDYKPFESKVLEAIAVESGDTGFSTEVYQFINQHNYVVNFIAFLTLLKTTLDTCTEKEIKITKQRIENTNIFARCFRLLELYKGVIEEFKAEASNNPVTTKMSQLLRDYKMLLTNLEKEIVFKAQLYILQQNDKSKEESVDFSITALLGNATIQFPLIFYESNTEHIYVTSSNGYSQAYVGNYWIGSAVLNITDKLDAMTYQTLAHMIECYSQNAPIFLLDSEYKFYDSQQFFKIIKIYAEYVMRKTSIVVISETRFAQQIQLIADFLIQGSIVVIIGAEWLSETQQLCLSELSDGISTKNGVLPGLLVPTLESVEGSAEEEVKLSLQEAQIQDFSNIGQMIFILPHLISCLTTHKFHHVPRYNPDHEINQSFVYECSSTFYAEGSDIETADSSKMAVDDELFIGTNIINIQSVMCEVATKMINHFQNYNIIDIEGPQPMHIFEVAAGKYASNFLELSSLLRQMGSIAPKMVVFEIAIIIELTKENQSSNMNIATVLMVFLMKELPAIFYDKTEYLEYPELLAKFIGASFELQANDIKVLIEHAYCMFAAQSRILKSVGIRLPSFRDNELRFDDLFKQKLSKCFKNTVNEEIQQEFSKGIFSMSSELDLLFVGRLIQCRKPFMMVCPRPIYAHFFFNILCAETGYHQYWVYTTQQMEDVLAMLQYSKNTKNVIIASVATVEIFMQLQQYVVAFWNNEVLIEDEAHFPYYACAGHGENTIPQLIILVNHTVVKECIQMSVITLMTSIYSLLPDMNPDFSRKQIVLKSIEDNPHAFAEYLDGPSAYMTYGVAEDFATVLRRQILSQTTLVKNVKQYELQEWKIQNASMIVNIFIDYLYSCVQFLFDFGKTLMESEIFKALLQEYLYRQGVIDLAPPFQDFDEPEKKQDSFELIEQEIVELEQLINENYKGTDLSGLLSKLTISSASFNVLRRQISQEDRSLKTSCQPDTRQNFTASSPLHRQYQFELDWSFMVRNFLIESSTIDAVVRILSVIAAACWSAISNYFLISDRSAKKDQPEKQLQDLEKRYARYFKMVSTVEVENRVIEASQKKIISLLGLLEDYTEETDENAIQFFCQSDFNKLVSEPEFEQQYNRYCNTTQKWLAKVDLPSEHPNDMYVYLWFDEKISFINYQLGKGYLSDITPESEVELIDAFVAEKANAINDQVTEYYNEDSKSQGRFKPVLEIGEESMSVQQTQHNFLPIVIDKERAALIHYISAYMFTPYSLFVAGEKQSGKSTLINIAKLANRKLIREYEAAIEDMGNTNEVQLFLKGLLEQFTVDIRNTQENEMPSVNLMHKLASYPSIHLQIQAEKVDECCDVLRIFINEHSIIGETYECISTDIFGFSGQLAFQDMSMIIELSDVEFIKQYAVPLIEVPQIDDDYSNALLKAIYRTEDQAQLQQFCKGFAMIRNVLPEDLCNSYKLYNALATQIAIVPCVDAKKCDDIFKQGNIHSLLFALKNLPNITDQNITDVAEQLATLEILNKLGNMEPSNPWFDSNIIIQTATHLIPSLHKEVFEKSLGKQDHEADNPDNAYDLLRNYHNHIRLVKSEKDWNVELPAYIMECLGGWSINQTVFNQYVENYNCSIDPNIYLYVYTIFIEVKCQQIKNLAAVECIRKGTGTFLQDPTLDQATYLIEQELAAIGELAMNNYKEVLKSIGSTTNVLPTPEYDKNIATSINKSKQFCSGFSLADRLSIRCPLIPVKIDNFSAHCHDEALNVLASMLNAKVCNCNMQFSSKFDDDTVLLFDVDSIYQYIGTSINEKNSTLQKQIKTEGKEFSFASIMAHSAAEQNDEKCQDFFTVLLILRVCLALCLGINPYYVLPAAKDVHTGYFGFTSQLESDFPFVRASGGQKLEYAATDLIENESDFQITTYELCGLHDEIEKIEIQNLPKSNFGKEMSKYYFENALSLIVLSSTLLGLECDHGIALRRYLLNELDPLSVEQGVFSFEEISNIATIISYENDYNVILTAEDVKTLLAARLALLVVDNGLTQLHTTTSELQHNQQLQLLLLNGTINLSQIATELLLQKLARQSLTISTNLQENIENSAKNVKLKANINLSGQELLRVQHNFFKLESEQFLQLYKNSGCCIPPEYELPEALAVEYVENCNFFAIALIAAYRFCTGNSRFVYISIEQFSHFAVFFYRRIMECAMHYLEQIDVLFTVQKYYELLANPSHSKKELLEIKEIDFAEFQAHIREVSAQATQNIQLQMSIVEIQWFRDYLHTIIEILKPSYKRIVAMTKGAIYDAVAMAAYVCFNFTGNVSNEQCSKWMNENIEFQKNETIEDKFAECINFVFQESGLQVQLAQLKADGQNKIMMASEAEDETPLFANNYMHIVTNEIPISFCLKLAGIYWKPGDFAYQALYIIELYLLAGITTFIVDQNIAWPAALYLNLSMQSQQGNTIDYNKYWNKLVDDELLNDDEHDLNKYYRETVKYIVIIDLEQETRQIASELCQAFESTSSILILQHIGSDSISQSTLTMIRNLLMFRTMENTTKGQQIIIHTLTCSLQEPIHKYPFIFALHKTAHFEDAFGQLQEKQQEHIDKLAVIVDSASEQFDQKYIMQDMFVQSMFGNNCSLRQQKETRLKDERLLEQCFDSYIVTLNHYILQLFEDFLETDNITAQNLLQTVIQQSVNLTNEPQVVLNTCKQMASLTRGKNTGMLTPLFQASEQLIKQLYLVFYDQLSFIEVEDQNVANRIKFETVLLQNGNKLASWVSNAIFFTKEVIDSVSIYHMPFSAIFTRDFMNEMHGVLQGELMDFLKQYISGENDEELLQKLETDEELLGHAIQYKQSVLAQFITKRVLPLICKRLFTMVPLDFAMPFFYLIIIMYLSIIGILQNSDGLNPVEIKQNTIEENANILELFELVMDENKDTHVEIIMYSLLQEFSRSESHIMKIDNYIDLLPKEVNVQKMMQMYWIWMASLQPYNKLLKETQAWFLRHHSSIASLANNKNALLSIIQYELQEAGVGNPIAAALYNQLQKYGVVQEMEEQFSKIENLKPISELPTAFQLPTPANIFILSILTMAVSQESINTQLMIFNKFLNPYTGIDEQFVQHYCEVSGNPDSIISKTRIVDTGSILNYMQDSLAIMFDQFGYYYEQNSGGFPSALVSDCLSKVFNVGSRVFTEFRKYQIEYESNPHMFRGKVASQPLIFVYYDSNIIPAYYVAFAHDLHYALTDLAFLKSHPISYEMPTMESLHQHPHVVSFPLNDPQHSALRALIDLLTKRKLSKHKSRPMFPIYVLVCSCSYGESVEKCPQELISQQGNLEFLSLLNEFYEVGNASYCYLGSPTQLDRSFAHYFTLCLCRTHMILKDQIADYRKRKTNELLTAPMYRPSLKGFVFLLLKFSIMMANPNIISDDFEFVKTVDEIIEMNRAAKMQSKQKIEPDVQSIDISILMYSAKNERMFYQFDEDLSELLRQFYLQQIVSLSPFLSQFKLATSVATAETPNTEPEDEDENCLVHNSFEKEELDNSSSTMSANNSSMFSFSETDYNAMMQNAEKLKQSFNDQFYKCLMDMSKSFRSQINMDKIKESISYALFPKKRVLLHVPEKQIEASKFSVISNHAAVVEAFEELKKISCTTAEILGTEDAVFPVSLQEFSKPQYFRTVFSSYALEKVIYAYKAEYVVKEGTQFTDFQEMGSLFKIFLMSIKLTNCLQYNLKSHYADPKDLIQHLFPAYLTQNIQANGVFNNKGFASHENFWEISALTYGPLLGDILNFLLVQQISSLNSKSSRLRLVITLEKPRSQPHVCPDGFVDIGKETLHAQPPFFIKICNMELFGACYDFEAQTICDQTPCSGMGYRQFIDLYASVALIMNDDQYDDQLRRIRAVTNNDLKVRIPFGYVAVPLEIGGYIRPFVLMRNKTRVPDEQWIERNIFLGVRYI